LRIILKQTKAAVASITKKVANFPGEMAMIDMQAHGIDAVLDRRLSANSTESMLRGVHGVVLVKSDTRAAQKPLILGLRSGVGVVPFACRRGRTALALRSTMAGADTVSDFAAETECLHGKPLLTNSAAFLGAIAARLTIAALHTVAACAKLGKQLFLFAAKADLYNVNSHGVNLRYRFALGQGREGASTLPRLALLY
jgi:hypothetical protein